MNYHIFILPETPCLALDSAMLVGVRNAVIFLKEGFQVIRLLLNETQQYIALKNATAIHEIGQLP
jgi:hypothetical protein